MLAVALLVLVVVAVSVLGRLRPLQRAAGRLQRRAEQAQEFQLAAGARLERQAVALREALELTEERSAQLRDSVAALREARHPRPGAFDDLPT